MKPVMVRCSIRMGGAACGPESGFMPVSPLGSVCLACLTRASYAPEGMSMNRLCSLSVVTPGAGRVCKEPREGQRRRRWPAQTPVSQHAHLGCCPCWLLTPHGCVRLHRNALCQTHPRRGTVPTAAQDGQPLAHH